MAFSLKQTCRSEPKQSLAVDKFAQVRWRVLEAAKPQSEFAPDRCILAPLSFSVSDAFVDFSLFARTSARMDNPRQLVTASDYAATEVV